MAMFSKDRLSEEALSTLLSLCTDGLWVWDVPGDEVAWSESFFQLLGYPPEARSVADILDITHPDDRERHRAAIERQLSEGGTYAIDLRLRRWDGSWCDLEVHGTSDHASDGTALRMYGFVLDRTRERERAEQLAASEKRFRSFMEYCPAAVFLKDVDGRHLYVNEPAARLAGTTPEKMLGASAEEVFPPETAAALRRVDLDVLESGEMVTWLGAVERTDGSVRWVHDVKFPVELAPGMHAVGGFGLDVTELQEANRMAAAAQRLESVGRLAGGIAHDFNNMLSVILSSAREASGLVDAGSEVADRLGEVIEAAERSAEITSQLLGFARRQPALPRLLDPAEHANRLASLLDRLVGRKIQVKVEVDATPCRIRIDPVQFDQVLTNLAVNARDAIGEAGHIRIGVHDHRLEEETTGPDGESVAAGDYVRIAVQDDGCGMDAAMVARIFEPFFTTKAVGEGTGLGLSMVYGIVRQNHGFVEVESEPGVGTTVHLHLPCARGDATSPEPDSGG